MATRDDYGEYVSYVRVRHWPDHVGPLSDLMEEALGHAVGLRECLYEDGDASEAKDRARILVGVLMALQESLG